ncbi:MAG: aromatic ring-hydroxylating dioxygenase subunit alpha [Actinobacteria bacterium]|nr:aromatic ring-hydroxylating dioxygenase subunit alpha [Actinomycetota bacterium]
MQSTLPYGWYTDPEVLRREQERIFRSAWQYAGHLGRLPEPGTYFTGRAGRTPIVVTRARDEEIRAFVNVCRHRGFVVAEGEGRRETLQCPYHAWTYGLDGSLRRAPRSEEEPGFPQDELGLVPVAVGTWGPFVFVNAGPDPEPLDDALGSMPAQIAELGLDVDDLVFHSRWEAELEANWKIVCENFLECYHCQVAHPGFAEVIDVSAEAYALDASGRLSSQYGPIRESGRGKMELDGELPRSQFHFLWPNLTVNIFPGHPNVSIGPVVPRTPDTTYRFLDYFFGPDVEQSWIDDLMAFDDQVGREDRGLVEGVHEGVASGGLERGVLMSRSEQLIGHFEALTAAALAD